jgi:putative hemolysin
MSQQEIMPEPQSNNKQSGNEEDIYAQPYYWSTQPEDVAPQPKEEPASSYDEPLTQNDYAGGYQPQNEVTYSYPENKGSANAASDFSQTQGQQQQQQQQFQSQQARNPYSPDGDTFETGYNPYNSYNSYDAGNSWQTRQSVPFWARPQRRQRGGFRWLWLVILAFIFMGPLLRFIGDALFLVFPLLFIGLIVFASAVFWSTIGPRRSRGRGNPNGWRRPWGW